MKRTSWNGLGTRLLVLLLLLGPLLVFGTLAVRDRASQQPLLPGLDVAAVSEIELSHGTESLLLKKRSGAGPWEIRSAADAPGDTARIDALLASLVSLKGRPAGDGQRSGLPAPVEVRLADADGRTLARLAFWSGRAKRLADGPLLLVRQQPLLPLWASPWSSLRPPRIDSTRLAKVDRVTRDGLQPLDDGAAAAVALVLGKLTAVQFVPAFDLNWTKAGMLRLTMRDGTVVDVFQTTDPQGRIYLRFESTGDAEAEAVRRFAFRTADPLP